MMTYKIPVYWTMYDTMEVEADSLKKAIDLAIDTLPLPIGTYVDGSFTIELDSLKELYPNEIRDEKIDDILRLD
jgi:hypothetical protein